MANLKDVRRLSDDLVEAQAACYDKLGLKSAPIDGKRYSECIEFCKGYIVAKHGGVNAAELALAGQMADERNAHITAAAANMIYDDLTASGEKTLP